MRIDLQPRVSIAPRWGMLIGAVLILAVLIFVRPFTPGAVTSVISEVPADVVRLGITIAPTDSAGAIPRADAIEMVRDAAGLAPGSVADAYLVEVTDPHTLGTDRPIDKSRVWLVRVTGFSLYKPGPVLEDGSSAPGHTAHYLYAYVDAQTGEILDAQYWE